MNEFAVEDLPLSARFILNILESNGWTTQKEIISSTALSTRTVKHALKMLRRSELIVERRNLGDIRRKLYRINIGENRQ